MIVNERDNRHEHILDVVSQMMTAARTAPKAKGVDLVEAAAVTDEEIHLLSNRLRELAATTGHDFFLRDADNILKAQAVVLIGTRGQLHALNCGYCGFPQCGLKPANVPCALNSIDLGIAVGSACATAADLRVDCRVMFSAGFAARSLNWLIDCGEVLALPVSISSKNPFFDRK